MAGGMSGVPGRRGRRSTTYAVPRTNTAPMASATVTAMARLPEIAASIACVMIGFPLRPSHAEGSLGRLVGGVRPPRRARDDVRGVHRHRVSRDRQLEPVQPGGGGPQLVLARLVVLRAVARAFEPLARLAERDPASEVDALLVQGHQALRGDAGVDAVRAGPVVRHDVEPAGAEVERT